MKTLAILAVALLLPVRAHAQEFTLQEVFEPEVRAEAQANISSSGQHCPAALRVWMIIQNGQAQPLFKASCSNGKAYQLTVVGEKLYVKDWTGVIFGSLVDERPTQPFEMPAEHESLSMGEISISLKSPLLEDAPVTTETPSLGEVPAAGHGFTTNLWVGAGLAISIFAFLAIIVSVPFSRRTRAIKPDTAIRQPQGSMQTAPLGTEARQSKPPLPDDPISNLVRGRVPKRTVPEVQELLEQGVIIAAFKSNGLRTGGEKDIWHHPTGLYLVAPSDAPPRVFSRIIDARRYRDRQAQS